MEKCVLFYGHMLTTHEAVQVYNQLISHKQTTTKEITLEDVEEVAHILEYDFTASLKNLEVIELDTPAANTKVGRFLIGFLLCEGDQETVVGLSLDDVSETAQKKGVPLLGILRDTLPGLTEGMLWTVFRNVS